MKLFFTFRAANYLPLPPEINTTIPKSLRLDENTIISEIHNGI